MNDLLRMRRTREGAGGRCTLLALGPYFGVAYVNQTWSTVLAQSGVFWVLMFSVRISSIFNKQ